MSTMNEHINQEEQKTALLTALIDAGFLADENHRMAFQEVDRLDFLRPDYHVEAYEDYAIPIGAGKKMNKPTHASFFIEALEVAPGDKVLHIGAGSGWTSALLGTIVGDDGSVFAVESNPELLSQIRSNLQKYDMPQIEVMETDALSLIPISIEEDQTFDKILINSVQEAIPENVFERLNPGGIMIVPIGTSLYKIKKVSDEEAEDHHYEDLIQDDIAG